MEETATARRGEHWDEIALRIYGGEMRADFLMSHNMELLDIYAFSGGETLRTPTMPAAAAAAAPWRA